MAYFPPTGSVVAYQGLPSSMLTGASIIGLTPVSISGNSSISGTVNIGTIPGSVVAYQGTSPWIETFSNSSIIAMQLAGSILATSATVNTGNSSVQLLNSANIIGSVATLQGTSPWNIAGSIAGTYTEPNVATSVTGLAMMFKTNISTSTMGVISATNPLPINGSVSGSVGIIGTPSISGTVNIGGTPNVNTAGSIVAFQGGNWNPSVSGTVGSSIIGLPTVKINDGTNLLQVYEENNIDASVAGLAMMFKSNSNTSIMSIVSPATPIPASVQGNVNVGGSVIARLYDAAGTGLTTTIAALDINIKSLNTNGSLVAVQGGTRISSIVGSIPSSLLTGNYGFRNDAVASFLGGNLTWNQIATDSAGRSLVKPFAAEESRIEGYGSTVNVSVTTLVGAAGAGLRNYITDLWFANTDATNGTLVTLKDGLGSVLGYTIAPSKSGSNLPGLVTPIRTGANATFDIQAATGVSVLYATVKGFKAP